MKILAIETSCDETAISLIEASGDLSKSNFTVLGNTLLSQAKLHAEFGGVYPTLAKREHAKNLVPILEKTLKKANALKDGHTDIDEEELSHLLKRDSELLKQMAAFLPNIKKPDIDVIAVTNGPGLEPALWVGVNFAVALSNAWDVPIIPVNHMEGHVYASLIKGKGKNFSLTAPKFPLLALLISGGHTELITTKDLQSYKLIGQTRDDAVGEAFDKVARMLGLPYPGGPEISRLAKMSRKRKDLSRDIKLPRPMLNTKDCDFSFSGLKTAVLYAIKNLEMTTDVKEKFAREFEDAVVEILIKKTKRALDETQARTLVIGGGVSANDAIREAFERLVSADMPDLTLHTPAQGLSTDNAIMIGISGYFGHLAGKNIDPADLTANGNLRLDD